MLTSSRPWGTDSTFSASKPSLRSVLVLSSEAFGFVHRDVPDPFSNIKNSGIRSPSPWCVGSQMDLSSTWLVALGSRLGGSSASPVSVQRTLLGKNKNLQQSMTLRVNIYRICRWFVAMLLQLLLPQCATVGTFFLLCVYNSITNGVDSG